jgi:hypothetical protein
MRATLALILVAILSTGCFAADIRKGGIMQVKADSIWFEKAAGLTEWQKRKKSEDAAAFASHQEKLLSSRDAWQFLKPLEVKIRKFSPRTNQVSVEMQTQGRMSGTRWFVDASAIER